MRIGIDLDDTVCKTSEFVHEKLDSYSRNMNLNSIDIMNDEFLKEQFFSLHLKSIYENVEIKRNAYDVLQRLKSKGNEIYFLTARSENMEEITRKWLENHGIVYDQLIMNVYGEERAILCHEKQIDFMIDDDPFNRKKVLEKGIPCLLFDDRGRYALKEKYATNWLEVERYIEGM